MCFHHGTLTCAVRISTVPLAAPSADKQTLLLAGYLERAGEAPASGTFLQRVTQKVQAALQNPGELLRCSEKERVMLRAQSLCQASQTTVKTWLLCLMQRNLSSMTVLRCDCGCGQECVAARLSIVRHSPHYLVIECATPGERPRPGRGYAAVKLYPDPAPCLILSPGHSRVVRLAESY